MPASVNTRLLLLLLLLPFALGCESQNKGKIEGTKWTSQAGTVKGVNLPAGTLKLDFSADGKLAYGTPAGTFTGTYSLGMGNTVTLNLDRELAGHKTHRQTIKIVGDVLTMIDGDGTSLNFNKVKAAVGGK